MHEMILSTPDHNDQPHTTDGRSTASDAAADTIDAGPTKAAAGGSAGAGPTAGANPRGEQAQQQPRNARLATAADCVAALQQLTTLVALGLISTAQAGVMRAIVGDLLKYYVSQASDPATKRRVNDNLLERLRDEPDLLQFLEPFLSDDQIASLMRD